MCAATNVKIGRKILSKATTELSEEALREHERTLSPAQRIGQPRLIRSKVIWYNFYERLLLFEILQRTLGCSKLATSSHATVSEQATAWRNFLNQLSWLCDYKQGGDTSSAIAVEDTAVGPTYWLAANFDTGKGALHLLAILQKLMELQVTPLGSHRAIFDQILRTCLSFSSAKFKNYRRLLLRRLKRARNSLAKTPDLLDLLPETRLLLDLKNVPCEDPFELSTFAFKYVKSETIREVYAKHRDKAPREAGSAWNDICHYIGRLGAWARAVRVIVRFAREQPQAVHKFHVDSIPASENLEPPPADHQTNLSCVLHRMLPKDKHRVETMLTQLRSTTAPGFDIDDEFSRKYRSKTFTLRTHAEVLVLEHFSTQRRPFFYNDDFVGSSKPSCYCCNLYFRLHTAGVATRPSHGNAWHKWNLPLNRPLNWDGKVMFKRMTEQIRHDILILVETSLPRRARIQDSTSGRWSAPTLDLQFV